MGGEYEFDAAGAHGFHQRQNVAAGYSKTVPDAGCLERFNDKVGVVHFLTRQ